MLKKELLDFCLEKNILLDNFLIDKLKDYDIEQIKIFLNKLKNYSGKKFLNKSLIENNQEIINKFIDEISINKDKNFLKLKEKIGIMNFQSFKKIEKNNETNDFEAKVKVSFFTLLSRTSKSLSLALT